MGTKSRLLSPRGEDLSDEGFSKWPFMTTHSWGEDPRGVWTLEINDEGDSRENHGVLKEWGLVLHGTKEKPPFQRTTHPDKPRPTKSVPARKTTHQSVKVPDGPTYTFGPAPNLETVAYKPLEREHAQIQDNTHVENIYQSPMENTRANIPQIQQASWTNTNNYPQHQNHPLSVTQPVASYETIQSPAYNYPTRSYGTSESTPYYGQQLQLQPRVAYDQWNNNNFMNVPGRTYNSFDYLRGRKKREFSRIY